MRAFENEKKKQTNNEIDENRFFKNFVFNSVLLYISN
jgi:hypothetical protein